MVNRIRIFFNGKFPLNCEFVLACFRLLQLHGCCLSVVLLRFLITGLQERRLSASGAYPR